MKHPATAIVLFAQALISIITAFITTQTLVYFCDPAAANTCGVSVSFLLAAVACLTFFHTLGSPLNSKPIWKTLLFTVLISFVISLLVTSVYMLLATSQ